MKVSVVLSVAGLAGIAVVVGQMNAGAAPRKSEVPAYHENDDSGGVALAAPDVTVSRLGLNSSGSGDDFAYYGMFNGIRAFAIASTSCNIGDAVAEWINSHSGGNAGKHPVITQNVYRLLNGRFEHIGQSWLKHSFCAVSEFTCGNCQPTSCPTLGIGCADTYWSGLNGSQSGLGPRSQINPWPPVGVATHTTYSTPSGNATIRGRLQIHDVDINAGGQNFAEIGYVTHDEPFANRYNNNSWREINLSLTSMSGVGSGQASVHFQEPGIMAWRANDSGVNIVNVDVPSDGRFHLGYRVTDNGDGTWHYEYALDNMNSDRAAGMFTVPAPTGVTVTNAGFHDVDYHSGEPYDGTDWPATVGSGTVSWATQDYATNVNANAVRWGTLYNFRFDADTPPETGQITIGLFKPGSPTSLAVTSLVPSPATLPCAADLNGDGVIDFFDLSMLLASWVAGTTQGDIGGLGGCDVPDGVTDFFDLSCLLAAWAAGGCP